MFLGISNIAFGQLVSLLVGVHNWLIFNAVVAVIWVLFLLIRCFGFSKVNISLVVNDDEAEQCVRAFHSIFFENEIREIDFESISRNGSATAWSNGFLLF